MYLICKQRDYDGRWNPDHQSNMKDKRGKLRNIYILVDVSLATGKREYDVNKLIDGLITNIMTI